MLQSFRVQCRHHRATLVWLAMTVSRTGENRTIMPQGYELCWKCPPILCVIFHRILCLSRLVMSDHSVVVVSGYY